MICSKLCGPFLPVLFLVFSAQFLAKPSTASDAREPKPQQQLPTMAQYLQKVFVPLAGPSPASLQQQINTAAASSSASSSTLGLNSSASSSSLLTLSMPMLVNQVPALPFCRVGQRFIVNHILFACHQYGEQRRGFKPFACAIRNHPESKLLTRNGTMDDQFFRYKCQDSGDGGLRLQALNCLLNEIEVRAGQSLRRGRSEYLCLRDSQGLFKLMEKQILHDFCLPGNRNESLLEGDKCPGVTLGAIHAAFGSGNEVIFDTRLMAVVLRDKSSNNNNSKDGGAGGGNGKADRGSAGDGKTAAKEEGGNGAGGEKKRKGNKKANKREREEQQQQQELAKRRAAAV